MTTKQRISDTTIEAIKFPALASDDHELLGWCEDALSTYRPRRTEGRARIIRCIITGRAVVEDRA